MLANAYRALKSTKRLKNHWKTVWNGYKQYRKTGQTPDESYQSLIALYCASNGYANDFLHDLTRLSAGKKKFPHHRGVLGDLSNGEVREAADEIRDKGYVAFPGRVPASVCDELTEFATTHEAPLYPEPAEGPKRAVYDAANPQSATYWFDEADIVKARVVQQLMGDLSIASVTQDYLGCLPVLDIVGMWWSSAAGANDQQQGAAGQLYHFDMNRIKWLKVMIYLTDVDHSGGPHCFVAGTHKAGTQAPELLERGYARISDEDINKHYSADQQHEIVGPRGTILLADTRAFHKGKRPEKNDRLVFQLNYCGTLFGAGFDQPTIPADCTPELKELMQQYPRMFARYVLGKERCTWEPARKAA